MGPHPPLGPGNRGGGRPAKTSPVSPPPLLGGTRPGGTPGGPAPPCAALVLSLTYRCDVRSHRRSGIAATEQRSCRVALDLLSRKARAPRRRCPPAWSSGARGAALAEARAGRSAGRRALRLQGEVLLGPGHRHNNMTPPCQGTTDTYCEFLAAAEAEAVGRGRARS